MCASLYTNTYLHVEENIGSGNGHIQLQYELKYSFVQIKLTLDKET